MREILPYVLYTSRAVLAPTSHPFLTFVMLYLGAVSQHQAPRTLIWV